MSKIILFSGGIDSFCLVINAIKNKDEILLIHFFYNHKANFAELESVKRLYDFFKKEYEFIDLKIIELPFLITDNMKKNDAQIIFNRNSIFLNIAINIAASNCIKVIEFGAVKNDANNYFDCTKDFINAINLIASHWNVIIIAPFINVHKKVLIDKIKNKTLIKLTSSCYEPLFIKGKWIACNFCNSCKENQL